MGPFTPWASIVERSPRTKYFIASDSFTVIIVHMTIQNLNFIVPGVLELNS